MTRPGWCVGPVASENASDAVTLMTCSPAVRLIAVVTLAACADAGSAPIDVPVAVVEEAFVTRLARTSNMDSPAIWKGPEGEDWLLTTGKWTNRLHVYDAATGAPIRTVGQRGTALGEFRRPNGIAVAGDLVLVVERDNARVQVLRLPDFQPVASFGEETLRKPYGIAVLERGAAELEVFITDDYRAFLGRTPRDRELGQRVQRFRMATSDHRIELAHRSAFGDTARAGRLRKVESLAVDPDAGILLIADEEAGDVKVYRIDGSFTGQVLWGDVIRHDPEGIALYACGPDDGYWIIADQHRTENRFLVFHRRSFELLGAFTGTTVRNTDGIALIQRPLGSMTAGVLFAVHNDRGVGAFSWSKIAETLDLRDDCVV